jgi:hypothetical protein
MQDRQSAAARSHAIREASIGGVFVLWIGAFALLVLALFVTNG